MSEMFDKSQMSETIDVPAGCTPLFPTMVIEINALQLSSLMRMV